MRPGTFVSFSDAENHKIKNRNKVNKDNQQLSLSNKDKKVQRLVHKNVESSDSK